MLNQMYAKSYARKKMLAERISFQKESTSYHNEDDPFRPLDFSNIEGCPHELHYDAWEEHAHEFHSKRDLFKFVELFMNFVEKYNFIHEDVRSFHKKTPRILVLWCSCQHISSFYSFVNVFLEYVMGDQLIEVQETSLWFAICQIKDQLITIMNEMYVANPSTSILEEIKKQNESLKQLGFLLLSKCPKPELEDLRSESS